jgi:hypothetical protein
MCSFNIGVSRIDWGRFYVLNFLGFLEIFDEKIELFLKNHGYDVMMQILQNLAVFCTNNARFFVKFSEISENIQKP